MSGLGRGYSRTRKYDNFKNYNYHKSKSSKTFKEAAQEWEKQHPEEVVPALHKSDAAFVERIDNINHSYIGFRVYFNMFGLIKKESLEIISDFFKDNEKNFGSFLGDKIINNSIKRFSKCDAWCFTDKKKMKKRKELLDSLNSIGSRCDFPVKTIGLIDNKIGNTHDYFVVFNLGFLFSYIYKNAFTTNFRENLYRKQVIIDFKSFLKKSRYFKENGYAYDKKDKTEYPGMLIFKLMPKRFKYSENEFEKYGKVDDTRFTISTSALYDFDDQYYMEQFAPDIIIKQIIYKNNIANGTDTKHRTHTMSFFIKDYNFDKLSQSLGMIQNDPDKIIKYARHWEIKIFNRKPFDNKK